MFCGDKLLIHLTPQLLGESKFEITYQVVAASSSEQQLAKAITKHVCIDSTTRTKTQLPEAIIQWLAVNLAAPVTQTEINPPLIP
jgi:1,4-dihydroxy-2-naphthoyl-CoA hydrolase